MAGDEYLAKRAMVTLAGDRALFHARQADGEGWARHLNSEEVRAFHESGHAVVAHALGFTVYEISITERRDIKVSAGYSDGRACYGVDRVRPVSKPRHEYLDDEADLRSLIFALSDCREELVTRTRQRLEQQVDAVLSSRWLQVRELASALWHAGRLDQEQIESILTPRRPRWQEPQEK